MLVEASYNGVIGSHLQAQLLDYNQDNPALLTAFGTIVQSTAVLNSKVGSALANQYGIAAPYPGFTGTVKQALRPYPAIHVGRHLRRAGRSQRPFHLSRRSAPF